MTAHDHSKAAPAAATDYEKRLHAAEMRYETQIRALEENNTRLAADLETRFRELGTLTRMMQEKEAEAAARLNECQARIAHLEQDLHSLRNSTSWRLTRPLRWLSRLTRS